MGNLQKAKTKNEFGKAIGANRINGEPVAPRVEDTSTIESRRTVTRGRRNPIAMRGQSLLSGLDAMATRTTLG